MRYSVVFCAFLALAAIAQAAINEDIVNANVDRQVDASSHILRERLRITLRSTKGSISKYHVAVPPERVPHLSLFKATTGKGKPLTMIRDETLSDGTQLLLVRLRKQVDEGKQSTIVVHLAYTSMFEPYPTHVRQSDPQLVRWEDSHVLYSPYQTLKQKATVLLASTRVESYTRKKPSKQKGERLELGPYKEVEPFTRSALSIHAENNAPFLTLHTVEREVEVSHWGNVAVEEVVDLRHTGATLKGGFSRFDYQMQRQDGPHFRQVLSRLPTHATDIYYRDIIGNISTSHVREAEDSVEMEILPRFPMFGGWKVQFYTGYSHPLKGMVFSRSDGSVLLRAPLTPSIVNAHTESLVVKVVLPEGATDIDVTTDLGDAVQVERSVRYTYLDSAVGGGRPVLVLRASNLIDEHKGELTVTYHMSGAGVWLEPVLLVGTFFVLFLVAILYVRFSMSISPPPAKVKRS